MGIIFVLRGPILNFWLWSPLQWLPHTRNIWIGHKNFENRTRNGRSGHKMLSILVLEQNLAFFKTDRSRSAISGPIFKIFVPNPYNWSIGKPLERRSEPKIKNWAPQDENHSHYFNYHESVILKWGYLGHFWSDFQTFCVHSTQFEGVQAIFTVSQLMGMKFGVQIATNQVLA